MRGIDLFEELRYIIELLLAEHLLSNLFAKRRSVFVRRNYVGFVFMVILGASFAWTQRAIYVFGEQYKMGAMLHCLWYILVSLLSFLYIKLCYEMSWSDVLFLGICSYAMQHIEYVAINEVVARGIWVELQEHLALYALVCIITCIIWYGCVAVIFEKPLRSCVREFI